MTNRLTTIAKKEIIIELHDLFLDGHKKENQQYTRGVDFCLKWLSDWLADEDVGTSEDVLEAIERDRPANTKDYRRIAEDYDTKAFIDGRVIFTDDIISYVSDNMRWVDMAEFMKHVVSLMATGTDPVDSLLIAMINFAKYPEINLRELDFYLFM